MVTPSYHNVLQVKVLDTPDLILGTLPLGKPSEWCMSTLFRYLLFPSEYTFLCCAWSESEIEIVADKKSFYSLPQEYMQISSHESWRALEIEIGLDAMDEVGVVSAVSNCLWKRNISCLCMSYVSAFLSNPLICNQGTWNSDLVLVPSSQLTKAYRILLSRVTVRSNSSEQISRSSPQSPLGRGGLRLSGGDNLVMSSSSLPQKRGDLNNTPKMVLNVLETPIVLGHISPALLPTAAYFLFRLLLISCKSDLSGLWPETCGRSTLSISPSSPSCSFSQQELSPMNLPPNGNVKLILTYGSCHGVSLGLDASVSDFLPFNSICFHSRLWQGFDLEQGEIPQATGDSGALVQPVSEILAKAGISIFSHQTATRDMIFVAKNDFDHALTILISELNPVCCC